MDFDCLHHDIWQKAREEARDLERTDVHPVLWGSDLDEQVLRYATENAQRAGVADSSRFFKEDARRIKKPTPTTRGTVICNPPYGERLMEKNQVEALYRDMGRCFSTLDPWQIYIITSHEGFERFYGRRADKTRRLYNGMIPCNLYQYFKPRDGFPGKRQGRE